MYLGKNKQVKILTVFLIISITALGQAGKSHKYRFNGDLQESNVITGSQSIIINYSLPELNIDGVTTEGDFYYRVSIPGHSPSAEPGKPEFPLLSRLITIPEGSRYRIRISDVVSRKVNPSEKQFKGLLYPAQHGEIKKTRTGKPDFVIDRKVYATRGIIKSDTVRIEYVGKVRNRQLSNLIISPVKYNPSRNSMEVITSMKIEVLFYKEAVITSKSLSSESLLFNQSLGKGVLNYNPEDVITGYSDQPVEMIILTDTSFRRHLEPFLKWKRQKGFSLKVIYKGDGLAGSTFSEIRETIKGLYSSSAETGHPPEYLMIVGDARIVPTYGTGYLTDMYYGEFDGNGDYIPDMFIGRVPASDTTSVRSFVEKIVQYEKFEFADTNRFYSRALALAGKDANYAPYMNGHIKYAMTNYLNNSNRINGFHFYYPEGSTKKDSVMKLLSNGLSFVNYSGHGSSAGWLHIEIKSPDVRNLTNKNMYPFIISNACRTAQFDDTASFGNKMLLAPQKGAVGFIGCSNDSYWDEDFYWAVGTGTPNSDPKYTSTGLGAYDRWFHTHDEAPSDWFISMGQVNYAGNLSVTASPTLRKKYYWETYTLLGDPSAIPITGTPIPFNVAIPDTLPNGIRSLSVTIEPFSYMAISDFESLWDASYASPSGSVVLDLPALPQDSCLIVITGQNRIPLIKTVYFSDIQGEFLNLSGSEINDVGGNDNKKADFGENFYLKLKISNLGTAEVTNLSATITSTSPWVTINSDHVLIGTLGGNSEIAVDNSLELTIDEDVPDLGIITVNLTLKDSRTEKRYKIDIPVHAPSLEIINCIIDDSIYGNGNFVADPGETFNIIFQVRNYGSSNTSGQLDVNSEQDDLEIPDPDVKSGVLQFGEITNIPLTVKLSESASIGDFISLLSTLDCSPFVVEKSFVFRVGKVRESFESTSFRVFPWINISTKPWTILETESPDGNLAARSGAIGHNGTTELMMRAHYSEPDSIRFHYKVSSEPNYDYFQFILNDSEVLRASGEKGWERKSIAVPAGLNKMEWVYKKDNSVSQGADYAMIDLIDFTSTAAVKYIQRDIEVARIVSPVQKEIYGQEPVSVRILNHGADTIKAFNLAYIVNNRSPVVQRFDTELLPFGDSVSVIFERRADLDLNGKYNIKVFSLDNLDDYLLNDTLIISLENTEIDESVKLFPSPFIDKLNIIIYSKSDNKLRFNLTDLSGKHHMSTEEEITMGENYIILDTRDISPSFYILNINGKNFSKSFRVIKVKR